jgi:hypothetical protein
MYSFVDKNAPAEECESAGVADMDKADKETASTEEPLVSDNMDARWLAMQIKFSATCAYYIAALNAIQANAGAVTPQQLCDYISAVKENAP